MNIIVAIPVNKTQAKSVLKSLKNIKESGMANFGQDRAVLIVANDYAQSEITKDISILAGEMFMGYDIYQAHDYDNTSEITALNHAFRHATQYAHDVRKDVDGFFFFQPYITPIKKEWWEIVKGEFVRSGKLLSYALMDILNEKKQSIGTMPSPCGFYHKNCPERINGLYGSSTVAFNDMAAWKFTEEGKRSDFIVDVTYTPDVEVDSQKALIVGDKKEKYMDKIKNGENFVVIRNYEIEALELTIKQAVAFLNYRFDKGEAEEIRKESSESGLLSKLMTQDGSKVVEGENTEVNQEPILLEPKAKPGRPSKK